MKNILTIDKFQKNKREKLLFFDFYEMNHTAAVDSFEKLKIFLRQPEEKIKKTPRYNLMIGTRQRAWDAVDILATMYSAGHDLNELRSFYPEAVGYWDLYAKRNKAYDENEKDENERGFPHFALPGDGYDQVNRMLCLAILLGWESLIPTLIPIIDFNNHQKDGLIEHIFACYANDRPAPPDDCLRHLPYFKTLEIFSASKNNRPALMAEYLEDWYQASRREPYYNSHTRDISFLGYWSWEAAAITFLLDIDDSGYVTAQFYPKDLVDFARQARKDYAPQGFDPIAVNELRAKAGDACPKTGQWQSIDAAPQLRTYAQNDIMENLGSVYGLTVWRLIAENLPNNSSKTH